MIRICSMLCACVIAAGLPAAAGAQQYPSKPIRFIAPFPAAGSSDLIIRVILQRMSEDLGQPVVVDNRPGAGGSLGTEIAAKSPPDGYTLLLGSVGGFAINPYLYKRVGYDPLKDFEAVAAIGQASQILIVHPSLPAKSVKEFLALARKKPKELVCGSGGVGTPAHFGCELVRIKGGVQLLHVPYKGTGQSVNDVIAGQIHSVFASMPVALPHVRAGKLRGLASSGAERSVLAPELPTMIEGGVPGFVSQSWWIAFVPANTPAPAVKRLGDTIAKVLPEPQAKERFAALGVEPLKLQPSQLMPFVRTEFATYGKIVKEVGISAQ